MLLEVRAQQARLVLVQLAPLGRQVQVDRLAVPRVLLDRPARVDLLEEQRARQERRVQRVSLARQELAPQAQPAWLAQPAQLG